jgi:hypothetical protein
VDLPLLVKFYDRQKFGLGVGVQYSRLVGTPKQYTDPFNPYGLKGLKSVGDNDFAGIAEGSYYFTPNWQLNLRYCYSWIPMGYSEDSDYRDFACFNNVIQVRLGYIFGQQFDEKRKAKTNAEPAVP